MSVKLIYKAHCHRITVCKTSTTTKAGKRHQLWEYRESQKGVRTLRKTFGTEREALDHAKKRRDLYTNEVVQLSQADGIKYRNARVLLCRSGMTDEEAAAVVAEADQILADAGVPRELRKEKILAGCREQGSRWKTTGHCQKTVAEVVGEFIERRRKEGVKPRHLRDLDNRLSLFSRAMACRISELTSPAIQAFMDSRDVMNRTLKNDLGAITNLTGFAKLQGYLPEEWNELKRLQKIKVGKAPIEIFTPAELITVLDHAPQSVLPVFLLSAFAGLRQSETVLIRWEHFDWKKHELLVPQEGKTGARRVPIEPNLRRYMEPEKGTGPIVQIGLNGISRAIDRTVKKINRDRDEPFVWKHNALRHSCASYWACLHEKPYRISVWLGHSMAVSERYYQNRTVNEATAREWFLIRPKQSLLPISVPTVKKKSAQDAPGRTVEPTIRVMERPDAMQLALFNGAESYPKSTRKEAA